MGLVGVGGGVGYLDGEPFDGLEVDLDVYEGRRESVR